MERHGIPLQQTGSAGNIYAARRRRGPGLPGYAVLRSVHGTAPRYVALRNEPELGRLAHLVASASALRHGVGIGNQADLGGRRLSNPAPHRDRTPHVLESRAEEEVETLTDA